MSHISVMPDEVLQCLDIQQSDVVLDGTLGGAGHSRLMIDRLGSGGRLICCDVDQTAIDAAVPVLSAVNSKGVQINTYHGSFVDIAQSEQYSDVRYNKILLDLGWSSNQFESAERGFSFMHDGPLDMRLSFPGQGITARDIVHNSSEPELVEILQVFGEEPHARRIAAAIVHERTHGSLETTHDLVRVIESAVSRRGKTHPATQTFQALRIAVNHEVEAIIQGIPNLWKSLALDGRLCVITFHSLEDRLVKRVYADLVARGQGALVHKKVITPARAELLQNPRSRSAKIRTIQRVAYE